MHVGWTWPDPNEMSLVVGPSWTILDVVVVPVHDLNPFENPIWLWFVVKPDSIQYLQE